MTQQTIDETHQERAALYALGVLGNAEIAPFEARMLIDPELTHLVGDLQNAAAALAHTVQEVTPAASLRGRVLAAVHQQDEIAVANARYSAARDATRTNDFRFWSGWAIAAGLAVLVGVQAKQGLKLRHELTALRGKNTLASLKIATLTSKLQNGQISVGAVAWDGQAQQGFLSVEKLPPLAANQDYQLWVIDPKYPKPVDGGVVRVDESGNAKLTFRVQVPIRSADQFAISLERHGGVPVSEGPMVMLSNRSSSAQEL